MPAQKRQRRKIPQILVLVFQIILAIVILLPFFWMFSVSLKPATEPFAIPARLWPQHPTLENYASAFRPEFRRYFLNSAIVSLSSLIITVSLALLAA
jgi:ABC-type glycerol-3-phosphate transport system permease component